LTPATSTEAIVRLATELAAEGGQLSAVDSLIASVGSDRQALETARDQVAGHLHRHGDDFEATAALTLLNRALARIPIVDPLDWRVRWSRHRKP
jgi:hypothetical protein